MTASKLRILVTGGTGFLGSSLLPLLSPKYDIAVLSRQSGTDIKADLTQWDGGIDISSIRGKFDAMIHLAGLYDLRAGEIPCLASNVTATHTALVIAEKAKIPNFVHASTVAVTVGDDALLVTPEPISTSRNFPDYYSMSKAHAETMVQTWPGDIRSRLVLRLGILVGDEKYGKIRRIDGPYHAYQTIDQLKGIIQRFPGTVPLPGRQDANIPLVPVNAAARAIANLTDSMLRDDWEGTTTLHLTPNRGVTAEQLYKSAMSRFGIEKEIYIVEGLPERLVKFMAEKAAGFPKEELQYLMKLPKLDNSSTRKILGNDWCPEFEEYETAFWNGYQEYVSNC